MALGLLFPFPPCNISQEPVGRWLRATGLPECDDGTRPSALWHHPAPPAPTSEQEKMLSSQLRVDGWMLHSSVIPRLLFWRENLPLLFPQTKYFVEPNL